MIVARTRDATWAHPRPACGEGTCRTALQSGEQGPAAEIKHRGFLTVERQS